jgi:hypothetical protein
MAAFLNRWQHASTCMIATGRPRSFQDGAAPTADCSRSLSSL